MKAPASEKPVPNMFAVAKYHFDASRAPHGLEWYLQSREAKAILATVAGVMGINPIYVTLATNAFPTVTPKGEETFMDFPIPEGYVYCGSRVRITSICPSSGDRASAITVSMFPNHLGIYTWTPVGKPWEGNSWVEGDVEVYGILPRFYEEYKAKGVCASSSPAVELLKCSGNPCNGCVHGRIQDMGNIEPDLTKPF